MAKPKPKRVRGADLLIAWRSDRDLAQQDAARLLGMAPSQLNRYERGVVIPDRVVMLRILAATGGAVPIVSWMTNSRKTVRP